MIVHHGGCFLRCTCRCRWAWLYFGNTFVTRPTLETVLTTLVSKARCQLVGQEHGVLDVKKTARATFDSSLVPPLVDVLCEIGPTHDAF